MSEDFIPYETLIRRALVTLPLDATLNETLDAITLARPKAFVDSMDEGDWNELELSVRRKLKSSQRFNRPSGERGKPFVSLANARLICRRITTSSLADFVECPECELRTMTRQYALAGGCLLCVSTRERWAALWSCCGREPQRILRDAMEDATGAEAQILADWLDEGGWPDLSKYIRDHWPLAPETTP